MDFVCQFLEINEFKLYKLLNNDLTSGTAGYNNKKKQGSKIVNVLIHSFITLHLIYLLDAQPIRRVVTSLECTRQHNMKI